MSSDQKKCLPLYHEVDGYTVGQMFSKEAVRSAINFKPRPDDLFIVTYPKCGTTWTQNIVAQILREGRPWESAIEFLIQSPFLEMGGAEAADKMKRPGAIKLHLPFNLTPYYPEAKYIFVTRNPKDCVVSFYNHTVNIPAYGFTEGKFDDYFELFMAGKVDCGDYYDTLLSWWEHKNEPNVLFITYEELKTDTARLTLKIAEFIDIKYKKMLESDPEMLKTVLLHSSFKYMKEFFERRMADLDDIPHDVIMNHPDLPTELKHFLCRTSFKNKDGKVDLLKTGTYGGWKSVLSEEQSARMNKKFEERTKGTDIPKLFEAYM